MLRKLITSLAVALMGAAAARAEPPPLKAYGKLPAVERIEISPGASRYAFVSTLGEARRLYIAGLDGKAIVAAGLGDIKVNGIVWAGEDHLLVFTSATLDYTLELGGKFELSSAVNFDLASNKQWAVFGTTPSVAHTVVGYHGDATVKGRRVGYFGGITYVLSASRQYVFDHGWRDLYKVDLTDGTARIAAKGNESENHWVVSPDGEVVAHSVYVQATGRWRLFAGDYLGKPLIDRISPGDDISLEGLGRTPGTVVVTDNTGDRSSLEEIPLDGGKATPLFDDEASADLLYDPVTRLLIGTRTYDDERAGFLDPKLEARYKGARKAFPGKITTLVSYDSGLEHMIVKTEGPKDAGTFWFVDIGHGQASFVADTRPDIPPEQVGDTRIVDFKAADGLEMDGVLTLPPGREARNLPLVVMPHGGPIDILDRLGFDWWAQAYASRGYAVFQPNFRGSGGRDVAFRQAAYGEWGRKMQTDISDGVAALAAQGIVDPKRACIVGASYGGYAALAGVTLQHGLYRCAVSVAGPANMSSFFAWERDRYGSRTGTTRYWRAVTGADSQGDAVLKAISPTTFADKADAPVLLIHGRDDTIVPLEQSQQMQSALKGAGKPVELVVLKGEDHNLAREDTRMQMLQAAVAFVQKHNPAD